MPHRGQRHMAKRTPQAERPQQSNPRTNPGGEGGLNLNQVEQGVTKRPSRGRARITDSRGQTRGQCSEQSRGLSDALSVGKPSGGVGSSYDVHNYAQRDQEAPSTKQELERIAREKDEYDSFFRSLREGTHTYDPRRDPVPSFPETLAEITQLVREPTDSDYE